MDKDTKDKILKAVRDANLPAEYEKVALDMATKVEAHEAYANPEYKWSLDDFELGKKIGRGKFGRVFMAKMRKTGVIVAIKTLVKKELVDNNVERQVLREIEIQSHLKHPNILELLVWFYDDFRIYLVLECITEGELYHVLKKQPNGRFNEPLAAKYTYQVADALHYCHQNEVIHRDIKPENLLLTSDGNIKVADFGWSVHAPSLQRNTVCGTIDYLPPEMVEGVQYKHYVDNWCLGVLCYEFLTGSPPFESAEKKETYNKITNLHFVYPSYVSKGAKDLISKLLVKIPANRLSLPMVMKHPWVQENMAKV